MGLARYSGLGFAATKVGVAAKQKTTNMRCLSVSRCRAPTFDYLLRDRRSNDLGTTRRRYPTHGAIWALRLIERLEAQGISRAALIGNTGLNLSGLDRDEPSLPFNTIAALFERAAELTGDDLLGLNAGIARDFRESGLLAYLGFSSQTVADMLANLARYSRVFSDAVEIDVSELSQTGVMRWHFTVPSNIARGQYVEFGAAGTLSDLRRLSGMDFAPESVTFHHKRRHNTSAVERFFGCSVTFGSLTNSMTFKPDTLALPLSTADEHLFKVLSKVAQDTLAKRKEIVSSTVFEVENAIARRLSQGTAQADVIAQDLGMSPRTLTRRFEDENTTFTKVLTAFRAHSAKDYLLNSDLPVLQIAFLLGYADGSTFSTAFKRWTGRTPAEFRKVSELG